MKKKAIVCCSGGMDSATVLADAVANDRDVTVLSFRYGSKHNDYELPMAGKLADHYNCDWLLIDWSNIGARLNSNLLRGCGEIPEGHYEDVTMRLTVVPGRNSIFAAIAMGVAQSHEFEEVWFGVHSGDHAIYPDCRPEWYEAQKSLFYAATEGRVRPVAPFLTGNKESILRRGFDLGVPYELTRTCYKDQELSCGKCGACQERLEAFAKIGKEDPIAYEEGVR